MRTLRFVRWLVGGCCATAVAGQSVLLECIEPRARNTSQHDLELTFMHMMMEMMISWDPMMMVSQGLGLAPQPRSNSYMAAELVVQEPREPWARQVEKFACLDDMQDGGDTEKQIDEYQRMVDQDVPEEHDRSIQEKKALGRRAKRRAWSSAASATAGGSAQLKLNSAGWSGHAEGVRRGPGGALRARWVHQGEGAQMMLSESYIR
mmetsp:Transcript_91288/g.257378  ORF Transcript_91288/g.257378 Transcript_91288/m.257378 type:complete len:206 (+) Transcript_91288:73-690(+)